MKFIFVATFLLAHSTVCELSYAGGSDVGHGGGGWVCRNPDDSIRWVKVVDLFEAFHEYGLITPEKFISQTVGGQLLQINAKIKSINPDFAVRFLNELGPILQSASSNSIERLPVIHDTGFSVRPSDDSCVGGTVDYEQIANYLDSGKILFANSLILHLSVTEQSALYAHEALFKIYRDFFRDNDSSYVRKVVAYLFYSGKPDGYPGHFFGTPTSTVLSQVAEDIGRVSDWQGEHSKEIAALFSCHTSSLASVYLEAKFDPATMKLILKDSWSSGEGLRKITRAIEYRCTVPELSYSYRVSCILSSVSVATQGLALTRKESTLVNNYKVSKDVIIEDEGDVGLNFISIGSDFGYSMRSGKY